MDLLAKHFASVTQFLCLYIEGYMYLWEGFEYASCKAHW